MFLEDISYSEKNKTFCLTFEDDTKLNISYESYVDYDLHKESEIGPELFEKLVEEDLFISAKQAAMNFINYRFRTQKEIEDRLYRKGFSKNTIEKVIADIEELGLIDDDYFAKEFIRSSLLNKNLSKKKTRYKLYKKGVDSTIIDKYFQDYPDELELENAMKHIHKKYRNKLDRVDRQKIYRNLISNGFNYYTAKKALDSYLGDLND